MNNVAPPLGAEEFAARFAEIHPPFTRQEAAVEAGRCLFCFDAPCTNACPTHIEVPRFIKKIAGGNLRGSAETILEANILGLSCARVCPVEVLCEGACVLHRYNKEPIAIGRLQRHAMDWFYERGGRPPGVDVSGGLALADASPAAETGEDSPGAALRRQEWRRGTHECVRHGIPASVDAARMGPEGTPCATKAVGCIGAGPASLACAAELRRRGYAVTVFESRAQAGGLNTYGVAEYKFRPADAQKEIELIRGLGVEFRLNTEVGGTISLEELEKEFAAIFIGVGLGPTQPLHIPGEELEGVVDALRFIAEYKTTQTARVGRRVVIIGGGNTAIDAATAARRLGAEGVHILYRRGAAKMPAFRFEVELAKQDGVSFHWHVQPLAIHGKEAVESIECARLGEDLRPLAGPTLRLPCDMAIVSIGQAKLLDLLAGCRGIGLDNGRVAADPRTGQCANPRYFAAGDCVNGGREVVDAVAGGKRAALGIAAWLEAQHG